VAIKGTALTEEQVRLLGRFTKSIRLALDSDFAGDAASIRSISLATELGMDVKVIKIEKYKDPDEFAQQDPHGFIRQIENPVDIWDFIIEVISSRYDLSKGSGKAMASREIVPVLAKISDKIIQAHYSKLVAEKLAVPVEAVAEEVNSYIERGKSEASKFDPLLKTQAKARREVLEERLLALILKSEPERQAIGEWQKIVKTHFVKRLLDELSEYLKAWPEFKILDFVNSLPSELLDSTRTLILIDVGDEDLDKEILEVINEINLIDINERMEAAQNKIAVLEKAGKKEELKKVKKEFALLARERSEFGH
jgi:DNA primase